MSDGSPEHEATQLHWRAPAVFVSYGSRDARIADAVVDALETHGLRCWIAPRDVTPGTFYAGAIVRAIDESKALVLILSENAASSPHVLREVERAVSRRHPLISLRLDSSPVPADLEYFINGSQWLDAGNDLDAALPRLIAALRSALEPAAAAPMAARRPDSRPTPRARSRTLPALAALAGLAIAGFAAQYLGGIGVRTRPVPAAPVIAPAAPTTAAGQAIAGDSVAVLAFLDLSEQHNQEYFADGLSEEIIDRLARVPTLRVIARTSSFYFKGRDDTIARIGTALSVTHVLEGSVRRSGAHLRITAKLVRTSDSSHVWTQTFDRPTDEVFLVQAEIASQVATALKQVLSRAAMRAAPTPSVDAYNQMLQGQYFQNRWQEGDSDRAGAAFREAVRLDPHYVDAWLGLAEVYAAQAADGDRQAQVNLALDAVRRALAIDPGSSRAHRVQGNVARSLQWDLPFAASEYAQALALAPDRNESLRIRYEIEYLRAMRTGSYGKQYWPLLEEGARLNPLDARLLVAMAFYCVYAGQLQNGVDLLRRAYALNPAGGNVSAALAYALLLGSRVAEARTAAEGPGPRATANQVLAMIAWSEGNQAESNRRVAELERSATSDDAFTLAQIHAWRGEGDAAFRWLDRAARARHPSVLTIRIDPILKRLAGDPRYQALADRLGLRS